MATLTLGKVRREARNQNWFVKRTSKNHIQFIPPDKDKEIVHAPGTPSDPRSLLNFLAEMKEQGFKWPPPERKARMAERRSERLALVDDMADVNRLGKDEDMVSSDLCLNGLVNGVELESQSEMSHEVAAESEVRWVEAVTSKPLAAGQLVSETGEAKSVHGHTLTRQIHNERVYVNLKKPDGGYSSFRLDKLVLLSFKGSDGQLHPKDVPVHEDGDPQSCGVANLRWPTAEESIANTQSVAALKRGKRSGRKRQRHGLSAPAMTDGVRWVEAQWIRELKPGYRVSSAGHVVSPRGAVLQPHQRGDQLCVYLRQHIDGEWRERHARLDKLMLWSFKGGHTNIYAQPVHKDDDRYNCAIDNLEWPSDDAVIESEPRVSDVITQTSPAKSSPAKSRPAKSRPAKSGRAQSGRAQSGRAKSGRARAAALTAERRSEISAMGAAARWKKKAKPAETVLTDRFDDVSQPRDPNVRLTVQFGRISLSSDGDKYALVSESSSSALDDLSDDDLRAIAAVIAKRFAIGVL